MKTKFIKENYPKTILVVSSMFLLLLGSSCVNKDEEQSSDIIQIEEQGSFTVGGNRH